MNRRRFLLAAASVAVLPGFPVLAAVESSPNVGPLIPEDFFETIDIEHHYRNLSENVTDKIKRMGDRLVAEHPDVFDPKLMMSAPVDTIAGQTVSARVRTLGTRQTFELPFSGERPTTARREKVYTDYLVTGFSN